MEYLPPRWRSFPTLYWHFCAIHLGDFCFGELVHSIMLHGISEIGEEEGTSISLSSSRGKTRHLHHRRSKTCIRRYGTASLAFQEKTQEKKFDTKKVKKKLVVSK